MRRGWGGEPQSYGGSEDRSQRYDAFIRQFDANGDGMISPNEVSSARRPFYEGLVRRAGLDPNSTISVQALRDALVQRRSGGSRDSGQTEGAGKTGGDASKPAASLVPGFGPSAPATLVPGFGPPSAAKSVTSSGTGSGTTPSPAGASNSTSTASVPAPPASPPPAPSSSAPVSSPTSSENRVDDRVRKYAEAMLRQYDKNKNNVLERDEWSQMRSTWHDADTNRDGVITLDELAARMANFSRSRSGPSSSPSTTMVAAAPSGGAAAPRRSIRFLLPHERLPAGLPDWFLRKDADADGQVSMAEYARSGWSNALAEEFMKYDLNGDGIITPEECLKATSGK